MPRSAVDQWFCTGAKTDANWLLYFDGNVWAETSNGLSSRRGKVGARLSSRDQFSSDFLTNPFIRSFWATSRLTRAAARARLCVLRGRAYWSRVRGPYRAYVRLAT